MTEILISRTVLKFFLPTSTLKSERMFSFQFTCALLRECKDKTNDRLATANDVYGTVRKMYDQFSMAGQEFFP